METKRCKDLQSQIMIDGILNRKKVVLSSSGNELSNLINQLNLAERLPIDDLILTKLEVLKALKMLLVLRLSKYQLLGGDGS